MVTNPTYTLIQFTLITRRGRQIIKTQPCWIEKCSFADGPGMKVKKMSTTTDITKAARWSRMTAFNIAVQFSHLPASLVLSDGTPLEADTQALQAEQLKRHASLQQLKREMAEQFGLVFGPLVAQLRKVGLK